MDKDSVKPIDAAIARLKATYTPGKGRPSEDVDDQPQYTPEVAANEVAPADDLIWPPPGLEPIHGEMTRLTGQFAIAVIILLLPLLDGALGQEPEAGSWGTVVAFLIDFVLLAFAYVRLRQLVVHAMFGIEAGYPRSLVWHVAADTHRDIPLILQTRAMFTAVPKQEVTRLLNLRTISATTALLGILWIPVSFPFITLAGASGALRGALLWIALLLPSAIVLGVAAWFRLKEIGAKRAIRPSEAVDRERAAQVSGWSQLYSRVGLSRSRSKNTIELKLATGAVWMALFLMLIPIVLAGITTAIPQFVVRNAGSYNISARVQMLQSLRAYQLPHDSTISPLAAGEAFHNIRFIGRPRIEDGIQKPPTRVYTASVVPASTDRFIVWRDSWPDSIFVFLRTDGITPQQRAALDSMANHPAHAELSIIARAPLIDVATARWDFEVADTIPAYMLPFGMGELSELALAHVARAALQRERGDVRGAETTLREIISAGFNLQDNSLTLLDDLVAARMVRRGAAALSSLYLSIGRVAEASRIRGMLDAIERTDVPQRRSSSIEDLKRLVVTRTASRGTRWETFSMLQTAAPCMNLAAALFGRHVRDEDWITRARQNLVRLPGEEKYFALLERGLTMRSKEGTERCSPRVLRSYWREARNFY